MSLESVWRHWMDDSPEPSEADLLAEEAEQDRVFNDDADAWRKGEL
jgi:hypothetical protein